MSTALQVDDFACLGGLAEQCEATIREMVPGDHESRHARAWLACADPMTVEALGITGRFATSGAAEAAFSEFTDHSAKWALGVWSEDPLTMISADLMVSTLVSAMRSAGYELDTEATTIDWLWSPFGPPIRGNSARFDGRDRHRAHISLIAAAGGRPDLDPKALLADAEAHVGTMIADEEASAKTVAERRSEALTVLERELVVASESGECTDDTIAAQAEVFEATAASLRHALLASSSQADFPLDAFGWASMTARHVTDWTAWVRNAIDSICGQGEKDLGTRFACWSAADLLMRALAYEVAYADDEAASSHLAHDLLGRPLPANSPS